MKLEWRLVVPGEGPAISTSLTLAESDELRDLAAHSTVLEVGSAYGYSAVVMALAGAVKIVAVDPHAWLNSYDVMCSNLKAYGVADRVIAYCGDSRAVLPYLAQSGASFDLVWIDGDHDAATVAADVANALPLLRSTGTLACHDYGEDTCPGVRAALDAWKPPPRVVDTLALYGPGEW